jgi:phosphonate transport system substrate-binding protein
MVYEEERTHAGGVLVKRFFVKTVRFLVTGLSLFLLCPASVTGGGGAVRVDPTVTFPAGSRAARPATRDAIRFGFENRDDLEEEARIYSSFLRYLEEKTGRTFELRFIRRNETVGDALGTGAVDFSIIGAFNYVKARRRYGITLVAREINAQGKGESSSAIITRRDGPVRRIADLRGKTFVFSREGTTRGHLIPRIMLSEAGVGLENLRNYTYADSNDRAVDIIRSGSYDAAGMQAPLAIELEKKGLVRIVALSEGYPSSVIAANRNVDPALVSLVREAVLAMEPTGRDRRTLYRWDLTDAPGGYMATEPAAYDRYEKALERLDPPSAPRRTP